MPSPFTDLETWLAAFPREDTLRRRSALLAERARIDAEIARLDQYLEPGGAKRPVPLSSNGQQPKLTKREAIGRLVASRRNYRWPLAEIQVTLSAEGYDNMDGVADVVMDMVKRGQLVRVARGLYQDPSGAREAGSM